MADDLLATLADMVLAIEDSPYRRGRPIYFVHVPRSLSEMTPRERWRYQHRANRLARPWGMVGMLSEPMPELAVHG